MFVAEESHKESDNEAILKEAKFCFKRLKEFFLKEAKNDLKVKIEEAEKENNQQKLEALMESLQEILNKEKEIKEL